MPSFEIGGAVRVRRLMAYKIQKPDQERLGLKLMPMSEVNATQIVYERDKLLRGLQGARGLMGPTQPAKLPGFDQYASDPGYYGDHILLTEKDLLERRVTGDWTTFDDQGTLSSYASTLLERRQSDRMEKSIFDLLINGQYDGQDAMGRQKVFDIYAVQKNTAPIPFTTYATAVPLAYLRGLIATAEYGVSVNFREGEMIMNRVTLNAILANQNAADLFGKRFDVGQTLNSVDDLNGILLANDLPRVRVYNDGYFPDVAAGVADAPSQMVRFVPDGKIVILGKRDDGEPIGEYVLTRAAQNGGRPGWWTEVVDNTSGVNADPPSVIVKAGHNGGPKLYYPEAALSVTAF